MSMISLHLVKVLQLLQLFQSNRGMNIRHAVVLPHLVRVIPSAHAMLANTLDLF
jgi:hypothetical protein